MMHARRTTTRRHGRAARAFTLAELLVAIALLGLLAVGINQIFASVNRLVGTGTAIAEVNSGMRIVEKQLRDDFAAFTRMAPQDTFMVIRNRMVGDIDADGVLDADEVAVYLSQEDRIADLEDGLNPYEVGSRAITTRMDEVLFLAQADAKQYQTFQVFNRAEAEFPVQAQTALIRYGHGLRPAPDPNFTDDAADPCDVPQRMFIADGDFGQAAGDDNRLDPAGVVNGGNVSAEERNRYAGDFFVVRHALLLAGGLVIDPPSIGASTREVAPYPIDAVTADRFPDVSDTNYPHGGPIVTDQLNPRMIHQGRTDICAMDHTDVLEWAQGLPGLRDGYGCDPLDEVYLATLDCETATPFRSGPFNFSAQDCADFGPIVSPGSGIDSPLWTNAGIGCAFDGGGASGGMNTVEQVYAANALGVKTALASMMTRILSYTELPPQPRCITDPDDQNTVAPEDFMMDVHAAFAMHCSSFEVAWTDGSRWLHRTQDLEVTNAAGDVIHTYRLGDIVWFDINLPREEFVDRATYLDSAVPNPAFPAVPNDDLFPNPEIIPGSQGTRLATDTASSLGFGAYDREATFGAPEDDQEYLAVFPFRVPLLAANGGFDEETAWTKPKLLRLRMTLHDPQLRLGSGRTVEVIVSLQSAAF